MLVLSATQIEAFDPATTWGCNRRWWFERIKKLRGPPDKALVLGDAVHQTIEEFLKTGNQGVLHDIALAGVQTLINYRPRVKLIEHKISLEHGYTLAGVPIVGKIDAACDDELIDWKTTSSIAKYAKTQGQLRKSTQMAIYADFLLDDFYDPGLEDLIWTLGYFGTKKREHDRVSVQVSKREIEQSILTIEDTISKMVTVATKSDPGEIEPNEAVCNIGFGCPHRAYCPRSGSFNMASLLDAFKLPAQPAAPAQPQPVDPKPDPAPVGPGVPPLLAQGVLPPDAAPRAQAARRLPPIVDVVAPAAETKTDVPAQPVPQAPPPEALEPPKRGRGRPKGSKNKPPEFSPVAPAQSVSSAQATADGIVGAGPKADLSTPSHASVTIAGTSEPTGEPRSESAEVAPRDGGPSIVVERITLRHGARIGMPDFSSVTVEAEYTGRVVGDAELARENLSMLTKAAMIKELDLYVKKAQEQLQKKAEAQANK